ncbi:MAG TPA: hypothetical protein VG368_06335, partial [Acidimicrobiales bacterium]|nr:hypothetical protein [Acidimicrobiales bacterium]
ATTPAWGTQQTVGSDVTLIISKGPGANAPIISSKELASQASADIATAGLIAKQIAVSNANPNVAGKIRAACLPDPTTSAAPTSPSGCTAASGAPNLAPGSTIYLFVYELPGNTGTVGNSGTTTTTTSTTVPVIPPSAAG